MRLRLIIALACAILSVPSVASADRYGPPTYGGLTNEALIRICRQQASREMGINIKYVIAQWDGFRNGNVSIRLQNQTGALVYRCMIDQGSGQVVNFFREGRPGYGPDYGPGPDYGVDRDAMLRACRDRASDFIGVPHRYIQGYFDSANGRRSIFIVRDNRGGPRYRCAVDNDSGEIRDFDRAY
ncbi:MAG TPA: hypothetical protein VGU69_16500 [Rhizomicrobium sp.]|nr:hypothetical protein [Rhizomicrobium sp.]